MQSIVASRTTYQTHFLLGAKVQSSMNKSFAKVQKNMKNIRKGAGYTESAFSKLGRTVKNAFAAAGIYFGARAIVRSFQSVTTSAMNLNDKMADVATLLGGDAKKKVANYKAEVQELAIAVGKSSDELSTGLYETISAIGDGPDTMPIFTKIAENAVAGNVDVAESADFVTGVMKSYGDISVETAKKVSDLGFQTVKLGKTTFPELAKNMGKVAPMASSLGVKMEPLFGAMATLTGVTGNTAEVATGVRGIMKAFIKPSSDMQKVITGLGHSSGEAMIKARGFKGSLEILNKITGGSTQEMGKLFRETEALTNALALTGDQADSFTKKTQAMTDTENASRKAFETKISTTKALWNRFKQLGGTIKEDFGNVTLPGLNSALTNVLSNSEGIRNKFKAVAGQLGRVFEVGAAAFNSVKEAIDDNSMRILFLKMRLNVVKRSFSNAFQAGKPALNWMINTGIPAAVDVLISLSNKALDVYNFFNDNWTAIEPIVFGITSALVAYKTAQLGVIAVQKAGMIVQSISKAYSTFQGIMNAARYSTLAASKAQVALNLAMSANPIAVVAIAIGALATAGYLVYKNWDKILPKLQAFYDLIRNLPVVDAFVSGITDIYQSGKDTFNGLVDFVSGVFTGNWSKAWDGAVQAVGGAFSVLGDLIKLPVNNTIGLINTALSGISSIDVKIPDWVPGVGGKNFGPDIPKIPLLAKGTNNFGGGLAIVGEQGPEMVNMPKGSQVTTASKTETIIQKLKEAPSRASQVLNNLKSDNSTKNTKIEINIENVIKGNADKKELDRSNRELKEMIEEVFFDLGGDPRVDFS